MSAFNAWCRTFVAAAWIAGGGAVAPDCLAQTLFAIPTDAPPGVAVADDQPLRIALHARDAAALAKVLGTDPPPPGADVLQYVMNGYPSVQAAAGHRWTDPSFVIDYGEPGVAKLSAEFAADLAQTPHSNDLLPEPLVKFVARTVHGSHNRGFDVASEVALHRDGDCKAYAVLTAALARAVGIPARVVLGLALIRSGTRYGAFGHAWAEFLVNGRWVAADAALLNAPNPVRYLPFGVLENEGMGYALDVVRLTPVWVQRVEVLGSPAADAPSR